MNERLRKYAKRGHRQVPGWLEQSAVNVILALAEQQRRDGVKGAVCEIGVHHGRSFILLCLCTDVDELAIAYDLFGNQQENVDGSGSGDLAKFNANVAKHVHDTRRVRAIAINSLALTPDRILRDCGRPPRLFSIDGGHTPEITYNDLRLAEESVCRGGLVFLDDFFNEAWPGVSEGATRYFLERERSLIPLVIVGNKVIFSNGDDPPASYRTVIGAVADEDLRYVAHHTRMFGRDVIALTPITTRHALERFITRTRPWRHVRHSSLGTMIKSLYLWLIH